jgi:hypothetical protein
MGNAVLVMMLWGIGFPAVIGVMSVIADRVIYGNWIWETRKNGKN